MLDDRELFNRIKKSDHQAFQKLFEQYYSGLVAYGTQLINSRDDSRELVQEVFLFVWENRKRLIIESVKTYLFTSLKNKALNHLRHQQVIVAAAAEIRSESSLAGLEILPDPFLRKALDLAIGGLPEKARECFTLTQVDGFTVKEAADQLGISEKTVENQLLRSRKILRKKLKKFSG